MAVFKIIKGEYKNKDAIKNVITYILGKGKENKTPNNIFGALGVDYENINLTISKNTKSVSQRQWKKDFAYCCRIFKKRSIFIAAVS